MKFLDLFEEIVKGDSGLTEETIYKSIQLGNDLLPLWGGNQSHQVAEVFVDEKAKTKKEKPITVFQGEGIIISLDGSAGNMTYKPKRSRFALNHHAGFFKAKDDTKIDLEFFSIFYQHQFISMTVSEGSKTLSLRQIYQMEFDIPSKPEQTQLMTKLKPLLEKAHKAREFISRVENLMNKSIIQPK